MPMFDVKCTACDDEREVFAWSVDRLYGCRACGAPVERVLRPSAARICDDQLPGGPQWVANMDRHPIWIENKTQYKAEMRKRGLRNVVEHVPLQGSDKSPHTSRWT